MKSDLNKTFSTCILKHFRNAPCIFTENNEYSQRTFILVSGAFLKCFSICFLYTVASTEWNVKD